MTTAINGSVYPPTVEELLPLARQMELTEVERRRGDLVPARNRLMREFHIGAPKADALREALLTERALAAVDAGGEPEDDEPTDPWALADLISPDPGPTTESGPDTTGSDSPDHIDADHRPTPVAPAPETLPEPVSAPADTRVSEPTGPAPEPVRDAPAVESIEQATGVGHPDAKIADRPVRKVVVWPVVLLALPAFVAVWSGWVGLGKLTGFGKVNLLPGIGDGWVIDSAITLPIGVETYAAYALYIWLSGRVPDRARRFARASAIASLIVGALGQIAYHLLTAAGKTAAPWWITMLVACLPVAVLGMGAALAHLVREGDR